MNSTSPRTPLAYKLALINLAAGSVGFFLSLLSDSVSTGAGQVSIGLFLLGAGEYINNPPIQATPQTAKLLTKRRRNVSELGNLLDIGGVLMIAVGLRSLFF
ncbi:MAG: hypothetical protein ACI8ZB_003852 [Desulforhopalus sp.]|jgi:hypothetical protein